jgi:hypothetical protein
MPVSNGDIWRAVRKMLEQPCPLKHEDCIEGWAGESADSAPTIVWRPVGRMSEAEALARVAIRSATGYKYRVKNDEGEYVVKEVDPDVKIALALLSHFHGPSQSIEITSPEDIDAGQMRAVEEIRAQIMKETLRVANERIHSKTSTTDTTLS